MTRPDSWMPLHVHAWHSGTLSFTAAERGAYLELLLAYWEFGPLPNDDSVLEGLSKCRGKEWRQVRAKVLLKFQERDGSLYHERADKERADAHQRYSKRATAGKAGGEAKAKQSSSNATAEPQQTPRNAEAMPEQPPTIYTTLQSAKADTPVVPKGTLYPEDFSSWYEVYPHKVAKDAALRAWKKLNKSGHLPSLEILIAAAKRYIATKPADVAYTNPATWLGGGRWQDEPATLTPDEPQKSIPIDPPSDLSGWRLNAWKELGPANYESWFAKTADLRVNGHLELRVKSKFAHDWINNHYGPNLNRWAELNVKVIHDDELELPNFLDRRHELKENAA